MAGWQFYLVCQANPSLGGFFPAPREFSDSIPRRGMTEQVAGGPSIHQMFPVEETDRVLSMSGVLDFETYERTLLAAYEAPSTLCEFSDGSRYWEVVITALTGPRAGKLVNYSMELKVCRRVA